MADKKNPIGLMSSLLHVFLSERIHAVPKSVFLLLQIVVESIFSSRFIMDAQISKCVLLRWSSSND
jgi:hypothetical protein